MVFDYKKEYKKFYIPKNKPSIVEIPKMNYIAVKGTGNSNEENGDKMNLYNLNVSSNNVGGYFSSEQLDLLSIIECQTYEDIINFIYKCDQLKGVFSHNDLKNFVYQDFEQLKRFVFKTYQNTLVPHDSDKEVVLNNTLYRLGLNKEEMDVIKRAYFHGKNPEIIKYIVGYIQSKYPNNYVEIIKQVHHFISTERDQNKNSDLYDELVYVYNIYQHLIHYL